MKLFNKALSVLISVVLSFGMIPFSAVPVYAGENVNVTYIDASGSEAGVEAIPVNADTEIMGSNGKESWYVVNSDVTVESRMVVEGTVNLILSDGKSLSANKGITVQGGSDNKFPATINIFGQSGGTGILTATAGNADSAGIGCNNNQDSHHYGTVNIYGGTVNATGGSKKSTDGIYLAGGAGIGGCCNSRNFTVNIYGGTVNAVGGYCAAGIGGGEVSGDRGFIGIYSGKVTATGGDGNQYCSGIGIGARNISDRKSVTIVINGGIVKAYGGKQSDGDIENGIGKCADTDDKMTANVTLNWTDDSDEIYATGYGGKVTLGSDFKNKNNPENVFSKGEIVNKTSLKDKTLIPYDTDTRTKITGAEITLEGGNSYSFTGQPVHPDVTSLSINGVTVTDLSEFDITYPEKCTDVGTYTLTVTAKDSNPDYKRSAKKFYTVTRVDAALTAAPTAKEGLFYVPGLSQELVNPGSVSGGSLLYSTNGTDFSESLPKATEAGNYTVSYKIKGDGNHNDIIPQHNTIYVNIADDPPVINGLNYVRGGYYYEIPDAAALNTLSSYVRAGNNCKYLTFKQTADISFDKTKDNNFIPIGKDEVGCKFSGTFDGDSKKITGINISVIGDDSGTGLFGYLCDGGTVKNICAGDFTITGINNNEGKASMNIAVITGKMGKDAKILNCTVENSSVRGFRDVAAVNGGANGANTLIQGCIVRNCKVIADNDYAGGIFAENNGAIKDCTVTGTDISTNGNDCGGIAGANGVHGKITNCKVAGCKIKNNFNEAYYGVITGVNVKNVESAVDNCIYQCDDPMIKGVGDAYDGEGKYNGNDTGCTRVYAVHCGAGVTAGYESGNKEAIDGITFYKAGAVLSISHEDHAGYTFTGVKVTASDGTDITASALNDTALTMPEKDVTVTAYEAVPALSPTITNQPESLNLIYGYTAGNVLSITADDIEGHTLSYQWYSNTAKSNEGGKAIKGETGKSYTIPKGKNAGTTEYYYCMVTATRNDNGASASKASDAAVVYVGKARNPAKVNPSASVAVGGKTIDLSKNIAMNGASGTVSYVISGEAKGCTLNGNTGVLTSGMIEGSVTVNVTISDDENHEALSKQTITVTITGKPVYTVTVKNGKGSGSYEAGAKVTVTADAPAEGKEFDKWISDDVIFDNADSLTTAFMMPAKAVTVKAAYKDKVSSDTDPVITKAPAAITGLVYNGKAQPLVTAGEAKGGTLYYALGDENGALKPYTGSVPSASDAGTYYVWYKVSGDKDQNYPDPEAIAVTISKASDKKLPDITRKMNKDNTAFEISLASFIPADAGITGGYEFDPEVSTTGNVSVTGSTVDNEGIVKISFTDGTDGDVITAPVKIISQNYYCLTDIIITLNNKTDSVYTAPKVRTGLIYDGSEQTLVEEGSVTGEGEMQYALENKEEAYSTDLPMGKDAGNYTVYYRIPDSETVNGVDPTPIYISIARKPVTVKAEDKTKEKGSPDPSFTALITGLEDDEDESLIQFGFSRESGEDAGTYMITPIGDTEQGNYTLTYETGILTIEEKQEDKKEDRQEDKKDDKQEDKKEDKKEDRQEDKQEDKKEDKQEDKQDDKQDDKKEDKQDDKQDEPGKKPNKVPFTESGESYASSEDNFAAVISSGKINDQILDFSRVSESSVDPSGLRMTVISGGKFSTKEKLKDKDSAKGSGGVKIKVGKDLIPKITCKKDGSATLTMEDGMTYTINFTVEKPKAQKSEKKMSVGGSPAVKTVKELFGTRIDSGELSIVKQKHSSAQVSGNSLIVDPAEKDSIKIEYDYLNKKYKMTIKIK